MDWTYSKNKLPSSWWYWRTGHVSERSRKKNNEVSWWFEKEKILWAEYRKRWKRWLIVRLLGVIASYGGSRPLFYIVVFEDYTAGEFLRIWFWLKERLKSNRFMYMHFFHDEKERATDREKIMQPHVTRLLHNETSFSNKMSG